MAKLQLPEDFREFLKLLNENQVEYLLIGGYAVAHHGYVRTTADLDVWIGMTDTNAERLVKVFREFGLTSSTLTPSFFLRAGKIFRMGFPPFRLEVHTIISGVDFAVAYANRVNATVDGIEIPVISLDDLKRNKLASGRHKDLADLDHLP
jgi:hypothetical protein